MKKKICILGAGVSGRGVADYFLGQGYEVVAVDKKGNPAFPAPIVTEESIVDFSSYEQVVVSPGWSLSHPLVSKAKEKAIGEIELGFQKKRNRMIGITGTNGKTTVTELVTYVLKKGGIEAYAAGNYGEPLIAAPDHGVLVVELSSYQLEWAKTARLDAAALLNITPDHLDWHKSYENYALAKSKIFSLVVAKGQNVLYQDAYKAWPNLFSTFKGKIYGAGCQNHDQENERAAALLVEPFGIDKKSFDLLKSGFTKGAHRIQFVREVNGIEFYDDSKGTNIDATIKAVIAMKKPVRLIAGGVDKGFPYSSWKEPFQGRVKRLYLIGESAEKIARDLSEEFSSTIKATLEEAVLAAFEESRPGEVILLSPGCSSFDMFKNYAERGETFQRIVHTIKG